MLENYTCHSDKKGLVANDEIGAIRVKTRLIIPTSWLKLMKNALNLLSLEPRAVFWQFQPLFFRSEVLVPNAYLHRIQLTRFATFKLYTLYMYIVYNTYLNSLIYLIYITCLILLAYYWSREVNCSPLAPLEAVIRP